ncbi:MAG: hypothetical protein AB1422_12745 [bacterium]
MKKLTLLTMLVLGLLATATYTTTVYAEDTQAYLTQTNQATDYAWGLGKVTPCHYDGPGPYVSTMTHTYFYGSRTSLIVDIADQHLEWEAIGLPNDYMIRWTNIYARALSIREPFYLRMTVDGCADVLRIGGTQTIPTYYAVGTASGSHPGPGDFVRANEFRSLVGPPHGDYRTPNARIPSSGGGSAIRYNKDLWARVVPDDSTLTGRYEDIFLITFVVEF